MAVIPPQNQRNASIVRHFPVLLKDSRKARDMGVLLLQHSPPERKGKAEPEGSRLCNEPRSKSPARPCAGLSRPRGSGHLSAAPLGRLELPLLIGLLHCNRAINTTVKQNKTKQNKQQTNKQTKT